MAMENIEEEAIIQMEKADFVLNRAEIKSEMITLGNVIPLQDQNGQTFQGRITAVGETDVTIDMNHPFAGEHLFFSGEVLGIREAHQSELNMVISTTEAIIVIINIILKATFEWLFVLKNW